MKAPNAPATPDPPQPKRLGSDEWIQMIVLGVVFSLIAFIVVLLLALSVDLGGFIVVLVVTAFAIGTFAAGQIVGWHGTVRWIAAFCLNVLIWFAVVGACVATLPPGALY